MSPKTVIRSFAWCYALFAAIWILGGSASCLGDTLARASGKMATETFDFTNTETVGLQLTGAGTAISTTNDPQILITCDKKVRSVEAEFVFSESPGEVNLYYQNKNEGFSDRKKIWGAAQNGGAYRFVLGGQSISVLRLDPCSVGGVEITLKSITVNPKGGLAQYFHLDGEILFKFLLYPGLLGGVLLTVAEWLGVTDQRLQDVRDKLRPKRRR